MRRICTLALAAATTSACAAITIQAPPLPPKPPEFSQSSTTSAGAQVAAIQDYCAVAALRECPSVTIYCEAFWPNYMQSCMLKANVPPSYLAALSR